MANESQREPPASGRVRRRVLIADDNLDAAISLAILLRYDGHDVRTVHDGPSAVRAAEAFQPQVALLDIGMPGLNGYQVAARIRAAPGGSEVCLIALTGWGQAADKDKAYAAGFDVHLTKPADPLYIADLVAAGQLPKTTAGC
jgi:CheY-like chemotaxis protein